MRLSRSASRCSRSLSSRRRVVKDFSVCSRSLRASSLAARRASRKVASASRLTFSCKDFSSATREAWSLRCFQRKNKPPSSAPARKTKSPPQNACDDEIISRPHVVLHTASVSASRYNPNVYHAAPPEGRPRSGHRTLLRMCCRERTSTDGRKPLFPFRAVVHPSQMLLQVPAQSPVGLTGPRDSCPAVRG